MRRPTLLRIGSQWSVITSGRSDSDTAAQGMKRLKVSMSLLDGMVPASNPRRLHLTCWTQSLSEVKVSYLLGRMSFPSPLMVGLLHEEVDSLLFFCSPLLWRR